MPEPFVLRDGHRASTVAELWTGAARSPISALYHLREGHFASWLEYRGWPDLAGQVARGVQAGKSDSSTYQAFMSMLGAEPGAPPAPALGAGRETAGQNACERLLAAANRAAPEVRQPLVDAFVAANGPYFPYLAADSVYFLAFQPDAGSVCVAGDLPTNCWAARGLPLTRLVGTALWYLKVPLPPAARVDYKLIVDGNWILDPLNPQRIVGGMGENSQVALPDWHGSLAYLPRPGVPQGQVIWHRGWYAQALQNARDIGVYLPPGYAAAARYPACYVHDGTDYLRLGSMGAVLDNLIAARAIEPLIAVFVPPVERAREYTGDQVPAFEQFLVEELLPFVETTYAAASGDPDRRGLLGTSLGGYASLRIGYDCPDSFARIAAQSASLDSRLVAAYQAQAPRGQRICVAVGTLCDSVGINDRFAQALASRGYAHRYIRSNEGHSWGLWRSQLESMLTYLWPG